jgi:mono/diheme cytochrome c family protein
MKRMLSAAAVLLIAGGAARNQMPPWGDMLKADDIEALWAYVLNGEN